MSDLAKKLKTYRISESEYHKICELLGRPPQDQKHNDKGNVEWALFSALWSEHCSYKSSRVHLKKFGKTINETVVNSLGENAGVIDLGFDERIAFKMESHNHPSFIEPYQGAATGVGGILRDIFTMGARPIAIADYLCFGEVTAERMPFLMDGVVRGISGYGNCVGVPTVTGQTNFHSSYNQNILVNAMAVGLFRPGEKIALSKAKGEGNLVVYVGAKTGKDGVHGAAMASESFDENSEAKKPNVQIGDPYFEKLLIESCLEVIQQDLVVAIQDMGAAGLTSSSFEMASKGQVGMILNLDQVPLRDPTMTPEEILLSESQERMLLVCEPKRLRQIQDLYTKWGLDAAVVGKITNERRVKLFWKGECLTDLDPDLLVENAPMYNRPFDSWVAHSQASQLESTKVVDSRLVSDWIKTSLKSSVAASRKPIYRQYDQRVGLMTARGSESDVAMLRLPDSGRGLAIAVGCRNHVMQMDAQIGGYDSVFYPSLQMAIKGAKVLAVTDCLNFGNPEKKNIMSEFVAAVDAIAESSILLKAPVISGNVSFYNETMGQNITSTPATGLVGIRKDVEDIPLDYFSEEGLAVFVVQGVGCVSNGLFAEKNKMKLSFSGDFSVPAQASYVQAMLEVAESNLLVASQVVSGGGLALSLAKMSLDGIGINAEIEDLEFMDLVNERFYDVILATRNPAALKAKLSEIFAAKSLDLKFKEIGSTAQGKFELKAGKLSSIALDLVALGENYQDGLRSYFQGVQPC